MTEDELRRGLEQTQSNLKSLNEAFMLSIREQGMLNREHERRIKEVIERLGRVEKHCNNQ